MLSTILWAPLIHRTTLLSRSLDRLASLVAKINESVRRVRFRSAHLQRMPAAETTIDRTSTNVGLRWLPSIRVGLGSHAALVSHPGSRVTYNVMLPADARVLSWCAVASGDSAESIGTVEFEIQVRTQRFELSTRCLVKATAWRFGRRWHLLRINTPEAGPARIVLSTQQADSTAPRDMSALWGNPRIEAPRSFTDLMQALRSALADQGLRGLWHRALPANSDRLYRLWVRESEPSPSTLHSQRQWSADQARIFTLITYVTGQTAPLLNRTRTSLQQQSYPGWEWILVATEESKRAPSESADGVWRDARVRVIDAPPGSARADAWNAALREAQGDFAALIDENDVLAPAALYDVASALKESPDCDVVYSDEDRLSQGNRRHAPYFKPEWSPELLLASNYVGRLAMMRVATVVAAGGFRDVCEPNEEWDLFLRLSRSQARFRRLPHCLYHRRDVVDSIVTPSNDTALRDHCQALGIPATVTTITGISRVVWDVQGQPTVSIVIPNRDAAAVLRQCVDGLLERTHYPRHELVIVDNASTEPDVLDLYRSIERTGRGRIVPFNRPFNYSAACNTGAAAARGELLLFLNNDIEVIAPDWLDELIRWAQRPDIGVVGAKLLYPDRTIQHAGVIFGIGLVGHIFSRAREGTSGLFGSSETYRNYLAVTGACHMMRKDVFERLGGYDERFRISFSDVLFCMEARRAGYRIVYTPHARLIHHESYTRTRDDSAQDMELLARYLRSHDFVEDPYLHPELNPNSLVPSLRPPFDPSPRQVVHDYVERVLDAATSPAAFVRG